MAKLSKLSAEDLRRARSAGFKRKAPKKPKQSASLHVMENYVAKHNDWVRQARIKISEQKKKEALKKMIRG